MSHYVKKASLINKEFGLYVGKMRVCPSERAHPTNKQIKKWANNNKIFWEYLFLIEDHQVHPEFGEAYLINCIRKKIPSIKLLNDSNPHRLSGEGFDKKSEIIVDRLIEIL
jgi:hypothetical protein